MVGHEDFVALIALFIFLSLQSLVLDVDVKNQTRRGRIASPALLADVRFFSGVDSDVLHQVRLPSERFVADVALERLQVPVRQMSLVLSPRRQLLATMFASDFAVAKVVNLFHSPD